MARIKAISRTRTAKTRQLQFVWRHKMMKNNGQTIDGKDVEVIDPGLFNRRGDAPDYFNAKLKLNGVLWVGNVVVTENASDWYLNMMDKDKAYDNVILAVVGNADTDIINSAGLPISVMPMEVPQEVAKRYLILASDQGQTVCHQNVKENCTRLTVNSWLSALQTERLEWQTEEIRRRAKEFGSWEAAYFVTIARTFGMGVNGDLMEQWAKSLPMSVTDFHADDLFQLEALFLGQAGLLELDTIPERFQHDALNEGYFAKLRNEYLYLAHKYSLQPLDGEAGAVLLYVLMAHRLPLLGCEYQVSLCDFLRHLHRHNADGLSCGVDDVRIGIAHHSEDNVVIRLVLIHIIQIPV